MENLMILVAIMIVLELFEAYIQYSDSLYGTLEKLYKWYDKSIFLFFLLHPAFYFVMFVVVLTENLNAFMIILLAFKIFDIFYKIEFMKKIFIEKKVSSSLSEMLEQKIPKWFYLIGVTLYPPLLFYAFLG